jgi:hypothetical protein
MRRAIVLAVVLAVFGSTSDGRAGAGPGGFLIVTNKGDRTLGIIDPELGRQVATVPQSGVTGHELVASPDGKTA